MLSTIRSIASLSQDSEHLRERIETARNDDPVVVGNLESERRNVERRLDMARKDVDDVIDDVMLEQPQKTKVPKTEKPISKTEQRSREIEATRIEERQRTSVLDEDERTFLAVLVSGETEMLAGSGGRSYQGLRAADLLGRLVSALHPIARSQSPEKGMRAMLGDLEARGFAFRTGPSLHRVRRPFVDEFSALLTERGWKFPPKPPRP